MSETDNSSSQNVAYIFAGLGAVGLALTLYYICRRVVTDVPENMSSSISQQPTLSHAPVIVVTEAVQQQNPIHVHKTILNTNIDSEARFVATPQKSRI